MPLAPEPAGAAAALIQLPRTSTTRQRQRYHAHLKLLTQVRRANYAAGFEGPIFAPGALVASSVLGAHPVVLECVGPVGEPPEGHRQRETQWILWRYDWAGGLWREIARAQSISWEWAVVLREPAIAALYPRPVLYDVIERSKTLTVEIVDAIDDKLVAEKEPVKVNVLCGVYDRVAGRIADLR